MAEVGDVVVLTGDYHEPFATDVPARPGDYPVDGNSAGVEFVAPSVTTPGLGKTLETAGLPATSVVQGVFETNLTAFNPWVRYHADGPHGFGVIELTADRAQYDFWYVDDILDPAAGARPASSWEVRRGTNKVAPAGAPMAGAACLPAAAVPEPTGAPSGGAPPGPRPTLVETGGRVPLGLAGLAALAGAAALAAARAARPPLPDDAARVTRSGGPGPPSRGPAAPA
jgi:hypothetical protein